MKKLLAILLTLLLMLIIGCHSEKELAYLSHSDFVYHESDCSFIKEADQHDIRILAFRVG